VSGRVAVIGAGAWGTALAIQIVRGGHAATLWAHDPELVRLLRATRENPWHLPGLGLPEAVEPVGALGEATAGADLVVIAVPSHAFREVTAGLAGVLAPGMALVSATKGLEEDTGARMTEVLERTLGSGTVRHAVLSGPTFALELARGLPTAAVVACADGTFAREVVARLATPTFRLYTQGDVAGVELGGALKNVIAIAAGITDGLDLGANARAALLTRGLAEMTRLGVALGARARTFAGLAGLGDLVLTCTGALSRNRSLGLALARGVSLAEWQGGTRAVAEGARTARAARLLATRARVEAPIVIEVCAVLFERKAPREALLDLLSREARPEEEPGDLVVGAPAGA
jgi:glycerol-3-phosphate dehydrogenase (NAD(P)+)